MSASPGRRLPLYLIPIVIGMSGVLFAQQIESTSLRLTVVVLSVSMPLFAGGNIMARLHSQGIERIMILTGLGLLCVGALVTASGFTEDLTKLEEVPSSVIVLSRWLGLASLFTGMLALLVLLVRREEVIGEIGERFRHLAEHMGDGFVLSSPDGTIVLVNQRFLDMAGLREEEVVGHNARDLASRMGLESIVSHLDQRAQGAASEYQLTWRVDGEDRYFWVSGAPIFTRRGVQAGILATVRDITERTRLSQRLEKFAQGLQKLVEDRTHKLRQSEERLRELLLHMNEGFLTVDDNYRIDFANERLGEMVGQEPSELKGKEIFDFIDPTERARLFDLFEAANSGQEGRISRELNLLRPSGDATPVFIAVSPILNPLEESARFSLVVTDVATLKGMQRQLEQRAEELQTANEELRMLDRAKDTFLSNVTHELRTPLSTVRGYVEMLESGGLGELDANQENALQVIERNLSRLGTLIDEMIEFSRMEIRGIRLTLTLIDLQSLAEECAASAGPQIEARNMKVAIKVDEGARMVWADRKRLSQVLTILVSNAVKFSHDYDTVTIKVVSRPDRGAAIEVIDRGIGIDPAYHRRIFDKFFQVDSAMNRRYEGAGIGLSIAKNIVEAHGGLIELESEPNKGSTFRLVLPAAVFQTPDGSPLLAPLREGRLKVVIVDDDKELLRAVKSLAGAFAQQVRTASSGYECLRLIQESTPDLVIMSAGLPDLSGVETARKLREEPAGNGLPVVLIGHGKGGQDNLPDDLSDVHYLSMPFDPEDLLSLVHAVCLKMEGASWSGTTQESGPLAARPTALLIDEDPELLEWMSGGLRRRHLTCHCARSWDEGMALAQRIRPDGIFADIDAGPDVTGANFEDIQKLARKMDIPVYGMTCMPLDQIETENLQGAFQKPFGIDEIAELVTAIAREPSPIHEGSV